MDTITLDYYLSQGYQRIQLPLDGLYIVHVSVPGDRFYSTNRVYSVPGIFPSLETHLSEGPASKPSFLNPDLIVTVHPMCDSCAAECSVVLETL